MIKLCKTYNLVYLKLLHWYIVDSIECIYTNEVPLKSFIFIGTVIGMHAMFLLICFL